MQIIENWTEVEGKVKEMEPSDVSEDFVRVKMTVNKAKPVEGFANLLEESEGQTLTVEVPKAAAEDLQKGANVSCRLRKATNKKIYAHPEQVKATKS
jgi:hypothetical protein